MVRIRYTETNNEGLFVSKPLLAVDQLVVVNLNTVNNVFTVTTQTGTLLTNGSAGDVVALKKKAKEALKVLGVVFQDEVRRRSKTEVI